MLIRLLIGTAAIAATTVGASVAARDVGIDQAAIERDFVPLDEIVVPIAGTQRIEGALRARITLAASTPEAAAAMTERLPEFRAAAVSSMIEFSRLYATGLTAVDATQLRADMIVALRAVDPAIGNVLITEVAATRV